MGVGREVANNVKGRELNKQVSEKEKSERPTENQGL
jgi:hypothetical protein